MNYHALSMRIVALEIADRANKQSIADLANRLAAMERSFPQIAVPDWIISHQSLIDDDLPSRPGMRCPDTRVEPTDEALSKFIDGYDWPVPVDFLDSASQRRKYLRDALAHFSAPQPATPKSLCDNVLEAEIKAQPATPAQREISDAEIASLYGHICGSEQTRRTVIAFARALLAKQSSMITRETLLKLYRLAKTREPDVFVNEAREFFAAREVNPELPKSQFNHIIYFKLEDRLVAFDWADHQVISRNPDGSIDVKFHRSFSKKIMEHGS